MCDDHQSAGGAGEGVEVEAVVAALGFGLRTGGEDHGRILMLVGGGGRAALGVVLGSLRIGGRRRGVTKTSTMAGVSGAGDTGGAQEASEGAPRVMTGSFCGGVEEADASRGKLFAGAAERNKGPIGEEVVRRLAPMGGAASGVLELLEVSSGTGQHAVHLCSVLPAAWHLQPTDYAEENVRSIEAYREELDAEGQRRVKPPLHLDASDPAAWDAVVRGKEGFHCVYNANVAHIAPEDVWRGLVTGAAKSLLDGGVLFMYGPFLVDGKPTSESNAAFDTRLRDQDPSWGLRDVADIAALGATLGLVLEDNVYMPANNQLLVFRKGVH